jgi:tRNA U34 5-methylaminomethyl-2-thiouridine-forming methyltransferase MnmC
LQNEEVLWRGEHVPISRLFDDPYYSLEDGLAESRHVFLGGNDLPARFEDGFHIAELGFGTGLNALMSWQAWRESGAAGRLAFTSFEAYPMPARDMTTALAAWPELAPMAAQLVGAWQNGDYRVSADDFDLTVIVGDAGATLPDWGGTADAWYLDGFAPARNPAMWDADLMRAVGAATKPGGTFATYTAAGHVRRALQEAGFAVTRRSGYGRKRHMSAGVK